MAKFQKSKMHPCAHVDAKVDAQVNMYVCTHMFIFTCPFLRPTSVHLHPTHFLLGTMPGNLLKKKRANLLILSWNQLVDSSWYYWSITSLPSERIMVWHVSSAGDPQRKAHWIVSALANCKGPNWQKQPDRWLVVNRVSSIYTGHNSLPIAYIYI